MKEIKTISAVSFPLILTGCFGSLGGSSWLGTKYENCWGDTGGENCSEEALPYSYDSQDYYGYGQYFLELEDEIAMIHSVGVYSYGEIIEGMCYTQMFTVTKEGTTYTLKDEDGDSALVCEKDEKTLICTEPESRYYSQDTVTFAKANEAFNYEAILQRIYSEHSDQ